MKAAVRTQYDPPEVLSIREVDMPEPESNEVRVKVQATTVNRTDCGILWGKPAIIRLFTGLSVPNLTSTGTDFAGEVEAIGTEVIRFQVGDRVWGFDDNGLASHAQYMTIAEDKPITTIPEGISYEQATASAEGAHYAYNFINKVKLQPDSKVMFNGATGAIGSAALQFLKYHGTYVTATANTKNINLIQSLGADRVIDYEQEDFTLDYDGYDFVFDAVGKSTFGKCKPLLKSGGVYISSELGPGAQNPFLALATPLLSDKKVRFPVPLNVPRSLEFTRKLLREGKFRPVIDRTYPLEEICKAFEYVHSGQKTGNVVIKMNNN
ncbi:MAG: NAD(P)-dependent alcohol dehydrogenase [Cyclobacteriaceae bacterium]